MPFGGSSGECTPCATPVETGAEAEPANEAGTPTGEHQPQLGEDDVPVRPPRRLKKCVSAGAATAGASGASGPQPASRAHPPKLKSSWKRKWQSNDETNSAPQVLDLRPDESDAHSGFLDNIVRKLRKKLDSIYPTVRRRHPTAGRMFCPFRMGLPIRRRCEFS